MKIFNTGKPTEVFSWWLINNVISQPDRLQKIIFLVLGSGFVLSVYGYDSAFQRSGALLVTLAVWSIYLGSHIERHKEINDAVNDQMKQFDDLDKTKIFCTDTLGYKGAEAIEFAMEITTLRMRAKNSLPKLIKVSEAVVHIQFIAGIVGTLVWGFGDIPFG